MDSCPQTFYYTLANHLKLWKETTEAAPANELQSIAAWLRYLGGNTKEKTLETMRSRMILLMREGAYEEAYQTARQQTAGARQIVLQHEIETCEERTVSRTRKIRH